MDGTDGTDGMVILGQRSSNKNKTAESKRLHKGSPSVPFQFLTLFKRAGEGGSNQCCNIKLT